MDRHLQGLSSCWLLARLRLRGSQHAWLLVLLRAGRQYCQHGLMTRSRGRSPGTSIASVYQVGSPAAKCAGHTEKLVFAGCCGLALGRSGAVVAALPRSSAFGQGGTH